MKRILIGGLAGAIATIPQSGTVWGLRRMGVYRGKAAPEVVSEHLTNQVVDMDQMSKPQRTAIKTAQHVGYGAVCGAAYGLLTTIFAANALTGALAGLGLWKMSYDGWIPAAGILPPPEQDEQGRQAALIAAHAVYGASLGALTGTLMQIDRDSVPVL